MSIEEFLACLQEIDPLFRLDSDGHFRNYNIDIMNELSIFIPDTMDHLYQWSEQIRGWNSPIFCPSRRTLLRTVKQIYSIIEDYEVCL